MNNRQLVYGADKIDQSDFMTPEELFFYKTANENRQQIPYMATGAQKNASPLSLIREVKTAFANAPSNSKFLAATSLSADSKPIELRELLSQLQSGTVKKIKFEGMKNLNDMSHLYAADVPKSIMVDDLNSMIDQINIYLPNSKKLKRAVLLSDGEIYAPQIVITKK